MARSKKTATGGDPSSTLRPKQRRFIDCYLKTWSATGAAREAGYKEGAGMRVWAHRMLQDERILAEIRRRLSESAMEADEVLARLAQQARSNIADFIEMEVEELVDDSGETQTLTYLRLKWEAVQKYGYLIKSIKSGQYGPSIEMYDSQKALELIGKHYGLFTDQIKLSGAVQVQQKSDLSKLSDEELEQLEALLKKANAQPAKSD